MEIKIKINPERITNVDGMMTFGKTEDGLNVLDFKATEPVEMQAFVATCKVQAMHDGNVYITERPRRVHNTPLFREDNCSLTLGRDGKYYFVFTLTEDKIDKLPELLMFQALTIAQKVERIILKRKGRRGLVGRRKTN